LCQLAALITKYGDSALHDHYQATEIVCPRHGLRNIIHFLRDNGGCEVSGSLFSYVDLEARIPARHPLRKIRQVVN
jgi:hypothetical protein